MITQLKQWLTSGVRAKSPTGIILHSTDGKSAGSSISWLRQIGLSYHYIIERDGHVTKCVPVSRRAFHAGRSFGWDGPDCNHYTVGIAFANHESKRERITLAQVSACADLCKRLVAADPNLVFISQHRLISPGRKTDPAMLTEGDYLTIAEAAGLRRWKP